MQTYRQELCLKDAKKCIKPEGAIWALPTGKNKYGHIGKHALPCSEGAATRKNTCACGG